MKARLLISVRSFKPPPRVYSNIQCCFTVLILNSAQWQSNSCRYLEILYSVRQRWKWTKLSSWGCAGRLWHFKSSVQQKLWIKVSQIAIYINLILFSRWKVKPLQMMYRFTCHVHSRALFRCLKRDKNHILIYSQIHYTFHSPTFHFKFGSVSLNELRCQNLLLSIVLSLFIQHIEAVCWNWILCYFPPS